MSGSSSACAGTLPISDRHFLLFRGWFGRFVLLFRGWFGRFAAIRCAQARATPDDPGTIPDCKVAFSRLRGEVWRARRTLLDFHEKDGTEPLGGFSVEPKRTENPIGEMSHVVSDKCSWHARRQQSRRHGDRSRRVAGSPLRFQDRRRNLLLLHSSRAHLDSGTSDHRTCREGCSSIPCGWCPTGQG
jgi:hypothetical protein